MDESYMEKVEDIRQNTKEETIKENDLKKSIEKNREILNKEILESEGNIRSQEILKLSRKLDELIVKYHNSSNEVWYLLILN